MYKHFLFAWCAMLSLVVGSSSMAADFNVSSPEMKAGAILKNKHLFNGFGCQGDNVSPQLVWKNAPKGTQSFALMVYDPDAPTGSGWWHWVVFNIPSVAKGMPENAGNPQVDLAPKGSVQSRTDFGVPGYGGACPPENGGQHRYVFSVFALDVEDLQLGEDSSAAMVGFVVGQHTLARADLVMHYSR